MAKKEKIIDLYSLRYRNSMKLIDWVYYTKFYPEKTKAIKAIRLDTGISLAEGKAAIEEIFARIERGEVKLIEANTENKYVDRANEEFVVKIDKKYNLKLSEEPLEEIREELKDSYDYVLQCLDNAYEHMMIAYRLSISDMGSSKRSISIAKYACLMEAEPFIESAKEVLWQIENQQGIPNDLRQFRISMDKWTIFNDIYVDGFLVNLVVQKKIKKALNEILAVYKGIERLRKLV